MPRLRARLPARATVAHQIAGYWSGDHRSRRGDEDEQHCYSHSWRIALLERFWQARHPPRYAAYLTPSSPRFRLSSFWKRAGAGCGDVAALTAALSTLLATRPIVCHASDRDAHSRIAT